VLRGILVSAPALAGLVIDAVTTRMGTEGIIRAYGIEGTIFGATIATAVLTIEEVVLTIEPVRRGAPKSASETSSEA
jgi:cation:H+ antiporter